MKGRRPERVAFPDDAQADPTNLVLLIDRWGSLIEQLPNEVVIAREVPLAGPLTSVCRDVCDGG